MQNHDSGSYSITVLSLEGIQYEEKNENGKKVRKI